jgi:hypothetical protein
MKRRPLKYSSPTAFAFLVLITLTSLVACGSSSSSSNGESGREAAFRAALVADGFVVNDGFAHPIDPIAKFDANRIDSAGGNNAGQPYKLLRVPILPSITQDPYDEELGLFRLRPDEAVVYVGPTPPQADYFSFTPFISVRHANPKVPKGDWVFAALGDPLNSALIRTEGNANPFQQQTIVIFTADRGVYARVAAQAREAGYPESMINLYVLPSALLKLGVSPLSDTLLILLRTANFTDQTAGDNYLANDSYAKVWRVTPTLAPALDPFPTPPQRNRKWVSEKSIAGLEAGLERLKAAILAQTPNVQFNSYESVRWFADSRQVLEAENDPNSALYHKFVAGEASDTPYLRTAMNGEAKNFTLGSNDMVVVYGVNHAATGLATYSSFGVYGDWISSSCQGGMFQYVIGCGDPIWNGVVGMTSHDFKGSAEKYIPGHPMAPYLYAVKVLRQQPLNPPDKYWVVVPQPSNELPSYSYGIALDKPITIGYRAYLNPVTASGPDYGDIIPDRAILFKLRN